MAKQYAYRARDAKGQLFTGLILAEDEAAVAGHVRNKGMYVTRIREAQSSQDIELLLQNMRSITTRDLAIFCRQFSTMLEAGLPVLTCLGILGEQTENPRLKDNLQKVYKNVQEGVSLGRAMEVQGQVFPEIMISMVEAGELGGLLDVVMQRLSTHFEKEHRLNEKVKAAMTYPMAVMFLAVAVVIFVLTFILPTFVDMFTSMKVELPFLTRALLALSHFLKEQWLPLLVAIIAGVYGVLILFRCHDPRMARDRFILHMPIFGSLVRKVAIARFTRTLASLIRGGVPLLSALEVVKKTAGNAMLAKALSDSQESIKEGEDLSTRLGASRIFPPMVVQMVAVGEQSGALDTMLDKVADFYEEDAEEVVNRLSSLLEPFLIAFLGIVIGTIILAILVPMFDVITNVNKIV